MAAIPAQLDLEAAGESRRSATRRTLHLHAQETSSAQADVIILDISNAGLLLQTGGELQVDEAIELELPGATSVSAVVKWAKGGLYGCQFPQPVSDAFVATALLRSPPRPQIPGLLSGPDPEAIAAHANTDLGKWSGAARIALLAGLTLASWTAIGALLLL